MSHPLINWKFFLNKLTSQNVIVLFNYRLLNPTETKKKRRKADQTKIKQQTHNKL